MYRRLISHEVLCKTNQENLSRLAYQIDAYALAALINFYNRCPELAKSGELWKSNLFVIRTLALIASEVITFFGKDYFSKVSEVEKVVALRNKMHQFRRVDFKKNVAQIDEGMGRSREQLKPHLDVELEYLSKKKHFNGTNIFKFRFTEAEEQSTVNIMQQVIRLIERKTPYSISTFEIEKSKMRVGYSWEVYCYTDIVKSARIKNVAVVDRLLLAYDDLCCVWEFLTYAIHVDTYLKDAPYLLFFLCKIVAIVLDETFDNLESYVAHSGSDDGDAHILKNILESVDGDFVESCRVIRNNLHYEKQAMVPVGPPEELYAFLQKEVDIIQGIMGHVGGLLNIKPSKIQLWAYRFFRWVQLPSKGTLS